ncbi:hypothetical protein BKI52_37415 [marine bacterium AO1-C]|nr:hypothetical protein BKI52_37415 [marine bacterium AO1-C]
MYQLEIKLNDKIRKTQAVRALSLHLNLSLPDAKSLVENKLIVEYTFITFESRDLDSLVDNLTSAGLHVRNVKDLNHTLDIPYAEKCFSHMWKEDINDYVLVKKKDGEKTSHNIYHKKPPGFCLIEDDLIAEYVTQKMLEAGAEVSLIPLTTP